METERLVLGIGGSFTESTEPVVHLDDTRDGTGVVTEEDTTEGGKGGHGDASELVLGGGGTDAPTCSNWTTSHDERWALE